jgi:hypothetical protein
LPLRVSRAVSAWQDQLMRLLQSEAAKRPGGATVRDAAPLTVVTLVAMLAAPGDTGAFVPAAREGGDAGQDADAVGPVPREVLASVVGEAECGPLIAQARKDLRQRVGLLLDEEMLRFGEVIEGAGQVDAIAAVRLYQAEYSLEAAR